MDISKHATRFTFEFKRGVNNISYTIEARDQYTGRKWVIIKSGEIYDKVSKEFVWNGNWTNEFDKRTRFNSLQEAVHVLNLILQNKYSKHIHDTK